MTRDELHELCREVYGTDRWAAPLAADLTASGRQTAPATVNHWQSGERAVASWLPDALVLAWHGRALRLNRAGARAKAVAQRLANSIEAELDADLDNAPRMG